MRNCFVFDIKGEYKGSPYSITERRVPELIPVLGSQSAGDVSHKPGGRLPIFSARPAVTLNRVATTFAAWWTEARWVWTVCLRLLPDSVVAAIWTQAPFAPESSTLATRLLSHPNMIKILSTVETSCTTNPQQIAAMELEGYSWSTCSKQPRLVDCRIGVVNKLDRRRRRRRVLLTTRSTCRGEIF